MKVNRKTGRGIILYDASIIVLVALAALSVWLMRPPSHDTSASRTKVDHVLGSMNDKSLVKQFGGVWDNEEATRRVTTIFDRIAEIAGKQRNDLSYQVTLVASKEINAFALPGGQTYLTRGLYELLDEDDEIAGVLAHELAHTVLSHGTRAVGRQIGMLTVAQVLLENAEREASGQTAGALGSGVQLASLAFSREDEHEADQVGMTWSAAAGYHPVGLAVALEKMDAVSKTRGQRPPEFLSTHPATKERIIRLRDQARTMGYDVESGDPAIRAVESYLRKIPASDEKP